MNYLKSLKQDETILRGAEFRAYEVSPNTHLVLDGTTLQNLEVLQFCFISAFLMPTRVDLGKYYRRRSAGIIAWTLGPVLHRVRQAFVPFMAGPSSLPGINSNLLNVTLKFVI